MWKYEVRQTRIKAFFPQVGTSLEELEAEYTTTGTTVNKAVLSNYLFPSTLSACNNCVSRYVHEKYKPAFRYEAHNII
jgi:hypothetical protein